MPSVHRHVLVAAITLFLASPAYALSVSLVQIGGTASFGVGSPGDTLVVDVRVGLEPGDSVTLVDPALLWDVEGGDVLELTNAAEAAPQLVNGVFMQPINAANAILGDPASGGVGGQSFSLFDAVYPTRAGSTFLDAIESVPVGLGTLTGPADFSIATATFVLSGLGSTDLGFSFHPVGGGDTVVGGAGFANITDTVTFNGLSVLSLPVPEPSTSVLAGIGLLGLALRLRSGISRADARASRRASRSR